MTTPGRAAPAVGSRFHGVVPPPEDTAPLFTVGQAAGLLGVPTAFLRRLDSEGVVIPARSAGGQRRYTGVEINHVAALAGLMGDGMTLAGAQRIIELENELADLRQQLAAARRASPPGAP